MGTLYQNYATINTAASAAAATATITASATMVVVVFGSSRSAFIATIIIIPFHRMMGSFLISLSCY